jgi:hypothetical protein
MANHEQLDWLRDHGVQIDHKGRIIVSLPVVPDDESYEIGDNERERSIQELMRRDVRVDSSGSRGRRRRTPSEKTQHSRHAAPPQECSASRIGRPTIGAEVRVYVQTSIAQRTREILAQQGMTLADVFDDYARSLPHAS